MRRYFANFGDQLIPIDQITSIRAVSDTTVNIIRIYERYIGDKVQAAEVTTEVIVPEGNALSYVENVLREAQV